MNISKYLHNVIKTFLTICTCIFICTAAFLTIFRVNPINTGLLWQIIFIAFITALINIIFEGKEGISRQAFFVRIIIHFLLINLCLFLSAYIFGWFAIFNKISMIAVFEAIFVTGYALVWLYSYFIDEAEAKELNKKLVDYKKGKV